jgi:hypothetical protein
MAEPIIIVGGVRYRKEDAARLGLTEDSGTPKKAAKAPAKKGAGDAGTVSGAAGGAGDADETGSVQPISSAGARQGK